MRIKARMLIAVLFAVAVLGVGVLGGFGQVQATDVDGPCGYTGYGAYPKTE
jgi:hypothetical protein